MVDIAKSNGYMTEFFLAKSKGQMAENGEIAQSIG